MLINDVLWQSIQMPRSSPRVGDVPGGRYSSLPRYLHNQSLHAYWVDARMIPTEGELKVLPTKRFKTVNKQYNNRLTSRCSPRDGSDSRSVTDVVVTKHQPVMRKVTRMCSSMLAWSCMSEGTRKFTTLRFVTLTIAHGPLTVNNDVVGVRPVHYPACGYVINTRSACRYQRTVSSHCP